MKFSYTLLKQFVPQLKSKAEAIELLSTHSFEAEEAAGNTLEIKLPANRYSDASSHLGIADELAAAISVKPAYAKLKNLPFVERKEMPKRAPKNFSVRVEDAQRCPRYSAQYFEHVKIGPSPKWMQEVLTECGLRPINNVVDIMNYVMVETGQPLHAFDYDKLAGKKKPELVVRNAKKGESIVSIDGTRYRLAPEMLVIADPEKPLAIAGVKGGAGCEVTGATTRILVEAANFDGVSIMKTSKKLGLTTDASQRFSHGIARALTERGLNRAAQALEKFAGAKAGARFDSLAKAPSKKELAFDVGACNRLLGTEFTRTEAAALLRRLGFVNAKKDLWKIPALRTDIETQEDLAEEIIRVYGVGKLKAVPPRMPLAIPAKNELVDLKSKVRELLRGFSFDEVYNHTFVSKDDISLGSLWQGGVVALENPVSAEYEYLRPLLVYAVSKNVSDNFRYYDAVRLFEIGNVFSAGAKALGERTHLCLAIGEKNKETFFELKGVVSRLLEGLGLADHAMEEMEPSEHSLFRVSGLTIKAAETAIGYMGFSRENVSIAELDLGAILTLAEGEREYEPSSKFPSVVRDVSMFLSFEERIGAVMEAVEGVNVKVIADVDLVDEYADEQYADEQSITLRIVFRAKDHTLTSDEVDKEMERVKRMLVERFKVRLR